MFVNSFQNVFTLPWGKSTLTCFSPADGGRLPAFSRALDGDVIVQLQALRKLWGWSELQFF